MPQMPKVFKFPYWAWYCDEAPEPVTTTKESTVIEEVPLEIIQLGCSSEEFDGYTMATACSDESFQQNAETVSVNSHFLSRQSPVFFQLLRKENVKSLRGADGKVKILVYAESGEILMKAFEILLNESEVSMTPSVDHMSRDEKFGVLAFCTRYQMEAPVILILQSLRKECLKSASRDKTLLTFLAGVQTRGPHEMEPLILGELRAYCLITPQQQSSTKNSADFQQFISSLELSAAYQNRSKSVRSQIYKS